MIRQSQVKCPHCGQAMIEVDGASLRETRESAGVRLRELSRRTGFSATHLSDVEHGRRRATPAIVAAYLPLSNDTFLPGGKE